MQKRHEAKVDFHVTLEQGYIGQFGLFVKPFNFGILNKEHMLTGFLTQDMRIINYAGAYRSPTHQITLGIVDIAHQSGREHVSFVLQK